MATKPLSPTFDVVQSPAESAYLEKKDELEEENARRPLWVKIARGLASAVGAFAALIVFLVAVKFIGDGFRLVLGCSLKMAFDFADNPIAGLMVGVVVTSLFQSSSSVTSIAVALVSADAMTLKQAIPVIMGANIGTCVTSTLVAFSQVGDRVQFERAMAAGTVHDIFNIMNVLVLLPIELVFHPLQLTSEELAGTKGSSAAFDSPIDAITKPIIALFVSVNSRLQNDIAAGVKTCSPTTVFYRDGAFKSSGMTDGAIGAILITMGVVIVILALWALVKTLTMLFLGSTKKLVQKVLSLNGYTTILFGFALTFAVQSSSITTSTFTPIAGLGVITLEQMYAIVLGANVGTTGTALMAALADGKKTGLALAFAHLWFNLFGILLWYPLPFMRNVIVNSARTLAKWSALWKLVPVAFLVLLVFVSPAVGVGVSSLITADATGLNVVGYILAAVVVVAIVGFLVWFRFKGGVARWEAFLATKGDKQGAVQTDTAAHV